MAASERSIRKDKNQNIQVFVRLRPINQREKAIRSLGVVEVINSREVVVRQSHQSSHTKKFTFDRAFGPNAEQVEVYKEVVSPLIAEVLAGYNCTVFAYGQTGTGKTHTMVGESSGEGTTWQNDPLAGMIPRALSHLFDELRITNTEYTVRVSYLELYNEELFDLLSSSDDNSKLRIYEDVTRKGSTIVNGLEEITVYNKNEVYQIMGQGQERKKVASTLMNAQSSRSHTVFTIVVHMKENCPKGEELVKIGKLNLVDLAGSENISKAGSDNPAKRERARECVNINQSLLTLGRVITALVEKHPHIPYRESKLTRILQESLGGRTKTSIIATISPGHKDLEETMSTLEYAHRARNIQNKPEINQKLTKQAILKDFAEEIDKLKRELTATREKNGVYLPSETYVELTMKQEQLRLEIQELLLKKRAMEEERARMEQVFEELNREHQRTVDTLTDTNHKLQHTESKLADTVQQCHEQEHLAEVRAHTERQLTAQAQQLLGAAELQAHDLHRLHDTVARRRSLESNNQNAVTSYRELSSAHRENLLRGVRDCSEEFAGLRDHMQADIDDYARDASMTQETNIQDLKVLITKMEMFMNEIKSVSDISAKAITDTATDCHNKISQVASNRRQQLQEVVYQLVQSVAASVQRAAEVDASRTVARAAHQWLQDASARVKCLENTQCSFQNCMSTAATRRTENIRTAHRERLNRLHQRQENIQTAIQELENGKKGIEARISEQQTLIESEREDTEARLQNWMEEERRSLEERLARHAATEREVLNARIEKYTAELEQNKKLLAESTEKCVKLQQMQLKALEEERGMEDVNLDNCEKETQECSKIAGEFDKDFGEGVSAISAEMCAFGDSVVRVVEHCVTELRSQLGSAHQHAQEGGTAILETDHQTTEACEAATGAAVSQVVGSAHQCVNGLLEKATEASTSTANSLQELTNRTSALASKSLNHQSSLTSQLGTAVQCVERLGEGVRGALEEHANAEGRYLMQEYRVYAPSGDTPERRSVQYPRQLVATSPRERILARLRAAGPLRRSFAVSPDSDCVLQESDEGRRDEGEGTSDSDTSESSVSEDSAVAMQ